jgi:hypothetical protein
MNAMKIFSTWAGLVAAVLLAGGCINIKGPETVKVGDKEYRPRDKGDKIGKDEAHDIAKRVADDEGAGTWRYKIYDKKIDGVYWVLFEHKSPKRKRGWKNYFAVRVAPNGRAKLYGKNGRKFPSKWDEKRIKKDNAYEIAKKLARKEDANPHEYKIHDKEIDGAYWVLFEHKNPSRKRGWKNHFAARVSPFGMAMFYK